MTSMPAEAGAEPAGAADHEAGAVVPEVGVGPWPGPLPEDPRYDPQLLADGDRRNVADEYRYWSVEAIVADLDSRRHPFHVAIENWAHDLNIGSVVRTANAFNAAGVHIVGRRRWNRRGAMVTDRYLHVAHHPDAEALAAWAERGLATESAPSTGEVQRQTSTGPAGKRLPVIGIDNVAGSVPIEGYALPRECVLLFGQESTGLTAEAQAACDVVLHITQYGSTRSINAGAAAAIAMHTWAEQHA